MTDEERAEQPDQVRDQVRDTPLEDLSDPEGLSDTACEDPPDEVRDELPEDLIAVGYVGPYQFPDNSRRRVPGAIYLVIAVASLAIWASSRETVPLVNDGFLYAAIALGAFGLFSITSGWRMSIDETKALVAAQQAVGFPVGHASAQQVWHGLRSRPTWRVLCYSAEEPPRRRGLVLVDAVDGRIIEHLVEDNPELDSGVWDGVG